MIEKKYLILVGLITIAAGTVVTATDNPVSDLIIPSTVPSNNFPFDNAATTLTDTLQNNSNNQNIQSNNESNGNNENERNKEITKNSKNAWKYLLENGKAKDTLIVDGKPVEVGGTFLARDPTTGEVLGWFTDQASMDRAKAAGYIVEEYIPIPQRIGINPATNHRVIIKDLKSKEWYGAHGYQIGEPI